MRRDRGTRAFWLLQLGGWGFYGVATFLTFLTSVEPDRWWGLFQFKAIARPVAGIAVSSALALGYRELDEDRPGTIAAAVVAGAVVGGVAWYAASSLVVGVLRPPAGPISLWPTAPHAALEYVFVMLAWGAAFFGVRAWRRSRERERRALEAEARASEARLGMLAYQLDPHTLFNALSSIRGLVRRDPERAERTVTRLAAFLRHALERPRTREVPLAEEIGVVEAYLDVERARLGEALDARVEIEPDAADRLVPPLLLHPLVENAVKHATREEGTTRVEVTARIEADRLVVEVSNPGTLEETASPGTGIGLENVRERLAHTHPGRHALELVEENGRVRARIEIEGGRGDAERAP